jgi:acyl dehydratase
MAELYFEDFKVGDKFSSVAKTITDEMIVQFAKVYDPQPFHLDPVAAKASIYGGLIASGFQTLALGFRLFYDTGTLSAASMGSPGLDELRWLRPVRPGDTLRVEMEVVESRPSRSKPDRGIMRATYKYLNQKSEAVLSYTAMHLLKRKPD